MLEDRDYMRPLPSRFGPPFRLSLSVTLIIINFVVFAVQLIFPLVTRAGGQPGLLLDKFFALSGPDLLRGFVWQLLTFQFLHGGPGHLVMNCLMLYFFGRPMEAELGPRRFLSLYFGAGVVGGLLQVLCQGLLPGHFGTGATLGASAGVFGLVAAFATLHREEPIHLIFPPVAIRAKWLLVFSAILAGFGLLRPDDIAHAAHAGGMVAGVLFALYLQRWQGRWHWPRREARPSRVRGLEIVSEDRLPPAGSRRGRQSAARGPVDEDWMAREVDPILEKISAHGIQSLTDDEKRILETARHRMTLR
jgi:membrane associated rhomboid family serine protease